MAIVMQVLLLSYNVTEHGPVTAMKKEKSVQNCYKGEHKVTLCFPAWRTFEVLNSYREYGCEYGSILENVFAQSIKSSGFSLEELF